MNIVLYDSFEKRENSTKRPTAQQSHITLAGELKDPCSMINPVFSIKRMNPDISPMTYTYAYIADFGRYYFVKDWMWVEGLWQCQLSVDALATYRTDIGSETHYILRHDSTSDFNGHITDVLYPATTDIVSHTWALNNVFTTNISNGCYIVGIISGGSSNAVGAISYFAMTSSEFGMLKAKLFSDDNLEIMHIIDSQGLDLTAISQDVLKTMYNPYQYIVSCMWFPFGKSAIPTSHSQVGIKIGWWNYPTLAGDLIYAQTLELGNESYVVTAHPQSSRGTYLNYAPYTRRTLIGRFGTVPLDGTFFDVGDQVNISYVIDLITGQCIAKITKFVNSVESLIAERNFLLGVPIQIAQVGTDYLGTAVSAINTVPSMMAGAIAGAGGGVTGMAVGALIGGASGIYNTLQTAMPQLETGGNNGSFLSPANYTRVVEQFYKIVDEDLGHKGRPLCENRQINTLSGYVLCSDGEVSISCLDEERSMINRYLTTGFFWE